MRKLTQQSLVQTVINPKGFATFKGYSCNIETKNFENNLVSSFFCDLVNLISIHSILKVITFEH